MGWNVKLATREGKILRTACANQRSKTAGASRETPDCSRLGARRAFAESFSMTTSSNTAGAPAPREARMRRVSLGRPRWENLGLVASLVVFWAGVILKILG
jgi:hypothetical protein